MKSWIIILGASLLLIGGCTFKFRTWHERADSTSSSKLLNASQAAQKQELSDTRVTWINTPYDPVPDSKTVKLSDKEIAKLATYYKSVQASDTGRSNGHIAQRIIAKGMNYLGTPYVFGAKYGQTKDFDCSSFLKYIFASEQIKLPRDSREQSQVGTSITKDDLQDGDLLFFTTPERKNKEGVQRIGHVALYMGNGLILHTFRPGIGVTVSEFTGQWQQRFIEARRVLT
ncbi:C40 family peptidase [Paenibacillus hexagrammi]|uniref:C40 family peptidase n=1 Tax=Paenibacillus hexagrammi TaxID=2908839 RepID=A0ABY3SBL3_9BACL|nr:C40 family peptidase [Paenibacillus sp. YPD9-1]UJF31384.1 C40 family peptidase [Paenibacillus sp. YPD9-1]